MAAFQAVDAAAAEAEAEQYWLTAAKKIVEPSRQDIVDGSPVSGHEEPDDPAPAQAMTSTLCMRHPCNACLAFCKLNDLGLVGACEGDMDSTLTMLMFGYAFGKPGFITDPLFDVSKNAVIHAHCVAPTKMDGPDGQRHPFAIRTHRDDNNGAAVEVDLRVGQEITCAKLANLDTMLLSAQKIIEIPDFDDRGCRTQMHGRGRRRPHDAGQLGQRRARKGRHDDAAASRRLLRQPRGQRPRPDAIARSQSCDGRIIPMLTRQVLVTGLCFLVGWLSV